VKSKEFRSEGRGHQDRLVPLTLRRLGGFVLNSDETGILIMFSSLHSIKIGEGYFVLAFYWVDMLSLQYTDPFAFADTDLC
jgi:hypothetical protein